MAGLCAGHPCLSFRPRVRRGWPARRPAMTAWAYYLLMHIIFLLRHVQSLGRDKLVANAAETTLAAVEIRDGCREVGRAEIRPQAVDETEFGIGAFPQQEIR